MATVSSSVINLLNTIVGAGILAMPFAYKSDGIFLGSLTILFAGLTSAFGLYLQGASSFHVPNGKASFFALSQKTYPALGVVFDAAIAIKCFGVGVSYLIIIADLMPQISTSLGFSTDSWLSLRWPWILISFAIVGPLSFLRTLDSLKYTSIVALASVGYLVVIVVTHFFIGDSNVEQRGPVKVWTTGSFGDVVATLPVIVFAYTCHQNMFSILNEVAVKTKRSILTIISISIGTAAFFYYVVGLCGYLTFGDNVQGNIVSMYAYSLSSTVARIAIVVLVLFSYPLQCHPCRASLYNILHWTRAKAREGEGVASERNPLLHQDEEDDHHGISTIPTTEFVSLTSAILIASFILSLTVHSLEKMLAFVGSTGSTSISFILPGIFGYSLLSGKIRYVSAALTIWGVIVMIVCLTLNIYRELR